MRQVDKWYILDNDTWFPQQIQRQWMEKTNRFINVCKKYVTNFGCAVDCGAHYGTWAVTMARAFDQVIAIEGRDDIFDCLTKNMKSVSNVECKHAAVGEKIGHVDIGITKRWEGSVNSGVACIVGEGNTSKVTKIIGKGHVPMITIDSLKLDNVGFIKLDIEGYEKLALQGAEQTLCTQKPVIIFEDMGAQCTQYGVPLGGTGKYLESLGAKFRESANKHNHIYSWD